MENNYTYQESIRMSLYQFLGGLFQICPDREATIATMLEELTRFSRITPEEDNSNFHNDMIKPMLKSTAYIITIRYNNLLNDTKITFGENKDLWPKPVKDALDNDNKLIDLLNNYINQL